MTYKKSIFFQIGSLNYVLQKIHTELIFPRQFEETAWKDSSFFLSLHTQLSEIGIALRLPPAIFL